MSSRKEYLEQASATYHEQIQSEKGRNGARTYLADHAINRQSIVDKYRLGYVAEPLEGDGRFKGMLAIPYLSRTGVVGMKFRRLDDGARGPKYSKHAGEKNRLYNTAAYFAAGDVIGICEGETDAIVATEILGVPTISVPGAQSWQDKAPIWSPVFKDFRTVLVFTDGDDAGRSFGDSIAESLGYRARLVPCDPGEDIASMVKAGTHQRLCQLPTDQ